MSNKVATFAVGDRVVYNYMPDSIFWMQAGVIVGQYTDKNIYGKERQIYRIRFDNEKSFKIKLPKQGQGLAEYTLIHEQPESIDDLL